MTFLRPVLRRQVLRRHALWLGVLVLAGCGSLGTLFGPGVSFGGKSEIVFTATPVDLNNNTPVAVDLVVVYDQKVLETISELSAAQWFAQRAQLIKDHPEAFDFWEWQWMPDQSGAQFRYEYHVGAVCAIVFADYSGGGDHRQILSPELELQVRLRANDFVVRTDP